jgi:hypothetical protein
MSNHIADANKMVDTPRTDAAYAASTGAGIYELFKESQDIERELNAANDRIKRLEEAGDNMAIYAELGSIPLQFVGVVNAWREAKEAKP